MLNRSNALVVLRELIRHVAVEVDPLDAIGVPAARRNHIHRRHHRLLAHRLLALVCHHLNGIIRQTITGRPEHSPVRPRTEVCYRSQTVKHIT
jgi:hypothetical protein